MKNKIIKRALGIAIFETEKTSKAITNMPSLCKETRAKLIYENNKESEEYTRVLMELEEDD